jgi:hypothetical protein
MAWLRMLLRPMDYLAIRHPRKRRYDLWLPLVVAALTSAGYLMLPQSLPLISASGVSAQIQELVKILPGFFIAALAAIATFQQSDLDRVMAGTPPTLEEFDEDEGRDIITALTRRRFLCFLFGYLAFLALALFIATAAALIVKPWALTVLPPGWHGWARGVTTFVFMFGFWHMMSIALLGLYYLTDRLHRK